MVFFFSKIPAFDVICRVKLGVCPCSCSERCFPGYSELPLSSNTNISKSQFDLNRVHNQYSVENLVGTYIKVSAVNYFIVLKSGALFTRPSAIKRNSLYPFNQLFTGARKSTALKCQHSVGLELSGSNFQSSKVYLA